MYIIDIMELGNIIIRSRNLVVGFKSYILREKNVIYEVFVYELENLFVCVVFFYWKIFVFIFYEKLFIVCYFLFDIIICYKEIIL